MEFSKKLEELMGTRSPEVLSSELEANGMYISPNTIRNYRKR